jgi:hypothetical protein
VAALTLLGNGGSTGWIWDYRCDCEMDYRVRSVAGGAKFWPATAGSRFSQRFFEAGEPCVKCGQTLSINGCAIHDARSWGDDRAAV